jgi:hypothetical protein
MYALIYDEHKLDIPQKKVISIHESRGEAEDALEKRKAALGRKVWECHTRIVWTEKRIKTGDVVAAGEYDTWRPGEDIPEGETHGDSD